MVYDVQNDRMRRLICLNHHFTLLSFSSGAAAHLFHELEAAFVCSEIGKREHVVGVEYAYGFHAIEVESFCNHLSANENVGLTVFKLVI